MGSGLCRTASDARRPWQTPRSPSVACSYIASEEARKFRQRDQRHQSRHALLAGAPSAFSISLSLSSVPPPPRQLPPSSPWLQCTAHAFYACAGWEGWGEGISARALCRRGLPLWFRRVLQRGNGLREAGPIFIDFLIYSFVPSFIRRGPRRASRVTFEGCCRERGACM